MILLDGAMGTALLEAGLGGALPERWLLDRPEEVARVHLAHARAGAEGLLTCTFNLASPRLRDSGVTTPSAELARRAVALARAAAPRARIAGAVGPTYARPAAPDAAVRERYAEAFVELARAGVDLLWAESQFSLAEARAALAAARGTGLPAVVTFTFGVTGDAMADASGEPALSCLEAVAADGARAVGTNCDLPGSPVAALLRRAAVRLAVPLVAKPSAGLPGGLLGPAQFAAWTADLAQAGASWIGGCCGTSAEHLAACANALRPVHRR